MKYGLIGLVAAAFASKGMSAVLTQAGYEWFIANWTGHFFDVSIPSVAIGDIIIPATKGKCSGGSRREASQCTRDDTAQEDNNILYTVEAYAANHTFMLSYLFHSRERSKSFNVTAYGDAYLSQSWRNSTFKILPSSITEIQTCLNHPAPCPAQSPPAANFWPPDPSEYVFSIVDWNVSQVAYTQDFNITGPDFDYGTGGRSIPRFNAHCKGYGSYEYNEGYVPLRYAQCAVEPRWVTAGYWVRQPPPGSKQLTLGLVVRLSRGDETMWDLFSNVDQAYTRNDETLPAFSANITNASQVAYIDPS